MSNSSISTASGWRNWLRLLRRDQRGTFALLFALAIIPLVGFIGLAVDTARGYLVKSRLSAAVDAAALAGGYALESPNLQSDITMFFDANFPAGYLGATVSGPNLVVHPDGETITLDATATIDTTLMRIFDYDTLTVAVSTEVKRETQALDVVLAIDMSGSMGSNGRIAAARDAATDLVNILYGDLTTNPLLSIGLVPWNGKVNITIDGSNYTGYTASDTGSTFTNPGRGPTTGQSQTDVYFANNSPVPLLSPPPDNWNGCAYMRYSDDGDDNNDADILMGVTTTSDGTDWRGWDWMSSVRPMVDGAYVWRPDAFPAKPGNEVGDDRVNATAASKPIIPKKGKVRIDGDEYDYYKISYKSSEQRIRFYLGTSSGSLQQLTRTYNTDDPVITHFRAGDPAPGSERCGMDFKYGGECITCLSHGITPLQHDKQPILDGISALQSPTGSTNIPGGLSWAWEVLSPQPPFEEAEMNPTYQRIQAIVLLTDGENWGYNGDGYERVFGSGTQQHPLDGGGALIPGATGMSARLAKLADNIKAQGVLIYTIQFYHNSGNLAALMKYVASSPDPPYYFFAPDAATLQSAFRQVANSLSVLRLSK